VYTIPPPESPELLAHSVERGAVYQPRLDPVRVSPPAVRLDELLASPVFGDPVVDGVVAEWVGYWEREEAAAIPLFLGRMASFEQAIDSALLVNDLPASLKYLPFIESGYDPAAASGARAVGLWQFMEPTAEEMGLEVTRLLDQRRDPIRSTEAALAYLSELRISFGSWFLALAAYNAGPTRLRQILRRHAPDEGPSDSLYWTLRHLLPPETQNFVPKLLGAILVAQRPAARESELVEPDDPFLFDDVTVPGATTLDVVADASETTLHEIEWLNPQFVRGMTPPGRESGLRVPPGKGPTFERNYAEIPATQRVRFVEHQVEEGETLSHIALRYGVMVADLHEANPELRPRYLRIGTLLTVPVAPGARGANSAGS